MSPRFKQFALFLPLLLTACSDRDASTVKAAPKAPTPILQTIVARTEPTTEMIELPARLQPDPASVVHIYPPAGGRLRELRVHLGDSVSRGQTLAILDSSDVAQARADFSKAQAEVSRANRALDRAKLLLDHKVLSEREFDDASSAAAQAGSELERSRERLRVLGVSPSGTSGTVAVLAPRSGVVTELNAAPGELSKSTDNANPICTIAQLDHVWVVGDVFERDLANIHVGDKVEIHLDAYPGRSWPGTVNTIADVVDPQSRTLKVRVVLANPKRELKPEMFASIRLNANSRQRVVVPASAIVREGAESAVYVKTAADKYERRKVTLVSASAEKAIIADGIHEGDVVVSDGASLLNGGDGQ